MPAAQTLAAVEPFTIASAEGLPIRGVIERPTKYRDLVILIHGFKGFREWGFFPWLAHELVSAGHAVCRFDFSRNGVGAAGDEFDELDLFRGDTYSTELSDLERVVEHCWHSSGAAGLPVALLGHSRGGAIALLGAASVPRLRSVITWSAISNLRRWDEETIAQWRERGIMEFPNARTGQLMEVSTSILDDLDRNKDRLDVLSAVKEIPVPLLVVHGGADETVPVHEAGLISRAARNASLLVVDGASHTFGAIHPLVHIPRDLQMAAKVSAAFLR